MQTDITFEKWLTCGKVPQPIRSIQQGIDVDHTSILPPIREVLQSQTVDLISVLADEVRSPLSIINLSVEMLRTHPPAKDSVIYLDIIARNSLRLHNMFKVLLNPRENA